MRLIALFNLKPGVSVEQYENWAKTADLPLVNSLPSVDDFQVFRATGRLGSDAAVPYQYIEIIDVVNMDQFGTDVASEAMQKVAAAFQELADVIFLTTEPIA